VVNLQQLKGATVLPSEALLQDFAAFTPFPSRLIQT
jgi:hypothetical protein